MLPMVRKQVYVEARHDRMLKRRARERDTTEAAIVREALDRADRGVIRPNSHIAAVDAVAGQKAIAFMKSLATRRRKSPAGRTWTREALHGFDENQEEV
jgi:hypothetical protein